MTARFNWLGDVYIPLGRQWTLMAHQGLQRFPCRIQGIHSCKRPAEVVKTIPVTGRCVFVVTVQGQRILNSCYRKTYVHLTHKNVSTEFLY
jgi:hypothetical protein